MELNPFVVSLPAIVALLFKGGIFAYAVSSKTQNLQARLYLFFLFALSIQNIVEISHFYALSRNVIPYFEISAFYAAAIIALAILFHLAVTLAFSETAAPKFRLAVHLVYLYAIALEALLLFTPWLISDYVRFGYSVTRVAGPVFFLFE